MARIRSLHPGQWTDDKFVECSPMARLLCLGVRNEADDQGVFEWNTTKLRMRIFPADNVDMTALLSELVDHDQVKKFEFEGRQFGAIRNFRVWQRPKSPNAVYFIPEDLRNYVGLKDDNYGNDDDLSGDDFPKKEKSPEQRKEEGGRRKEKKDSADAASTQGEKPSRRKPETPLPADWVCPEDWIAEESAKFPAIDLADQAQRFKNHAHQNDRRCRDWRAAFRNWVLGTAEKRGIKAVGSAASAAPDGEMAGVDDFEFRERITALTRAGYTLSEINGLPLKTMGDEAFRAKLAAKKPPASLFEQRAAE